MKYYAPYGSTDPDAPYVDKDVPGAVRGSAVPAKAIEKPQREIVDVISKSGLAPSDGLQLAEAIQSGRLNYAVAGGTANVLTAALPSMPTALNAGLRISLKIAARNTLSATLNLNGLGAKPIYTQRGQIIAEGDLNPPMIADLIYDGTRWVLLGTVMQNLSADLTLYVRPDGNDNNDGFSNTAASAFQTLQGAYNAVRSRYNANGYQITLQLGIPGTYAGLVHSTWPGILKVSGDAANRSSYVIAPSPLTNPLACFFTSKELQVVGVKMQATASTNRLLQVVGGITDILSCDWASMGGASMIIGESGGRVTLRGTHNIAGSTSSFIAMLSAAQLFIGDASSVFLGVMVGNPAFAATAGANSGGLIEVRNGSFSGAATGPRYALERNGVINTNGGGANYFPGSIAGSSSTGGQYV